MADQTKAAAAAATPNTQATATDTAAAEKITAAAQAAADKTIADAQTIAAKIVADAQAAAATKDPVAEKAPTKSSSIKAISEVKEIANAGFTYNGKEYLFKAKNIIIGKVMYSTDDLLAVPDNPKLAALVDGGSRVIALKH